MMVKVTQFPSMWRLDTAAATVPVGLIVIVVDIGPFAPPLLFYQMMILMMSL